MERVIPYWVWKKFDGNWEKLMIKTSQWRERHCRTNARVKNKNQKEQDCESQSQDFEQDSYQSEYGRLT